MRARDHWWGWPRGYVPGESWSKGTGRGKLRRHLTATLEVEFHLIYSPEHSAWRVKINRARGPAQFLPFHAVPRALRDRLRSVIEGSAHGRRKTRKVLAFRGPGITRIRSKA